MIPTYYLSLRDPQILFVNLKKKNLWNYYPNKPEFKRTSLRKSLTNSPDLTNQTAGIIMFGQDAVVIMGYIVAMFSQVLIPENNRSLLIFL